jgi:tRNA 2-thiouridine synthesizing protein E
MLLLTWRISIRHFPQEAAMNKLKGKNKTYTLDADGSLVDPVQWDEDFAEAMAPRLGIPNGLTQSHWDVLKFIRKTYTETGTCPIIHKTCKVHKLGIKEMEKLFPTGYQRGACKLAGVSFMANGVCAPFTPTLKIAAGRVALEKRVYRVNVQGFLVDPKEWDEDYATCKAGELLIQGALTEKHWEIIRYLRSEFEKNGKIPTVYSTCEAIGIDIDELAKLFPSGYHRGAVKIAGLNS